MSCIENTSGAAFRGQVCSYIISIIFFYISRAVPCIENISGEAFRDEKCSYNINNFVPIIHWNNCHKKKKFILGFEPLFSLQITLHPRPSACKSLPFCAFRGFFFVFVFLFLFLFVCLILFLFMFIFIYGFGKGVQWVNNLAWQHMLVLYLEDFH